MRGPFGIKITFWRLVLAAIITVGLYATLVRLGKGLGAATGLSDEFPWGIWIGFDVMCGVALAAGGFTVAGIVYVFHLEKFRPILRATILTAFLGYIMAIASLLLDIGHPWRIWHPMVMWNEHSVMFEVAWCVMMYTTVLALEFSPAVLERFKMKRLLHILHYVTPPLVIIGVLLSTLHQSSLGTLFVIVPNKLHGLWYTPFLPVLFYISAIATGLSMTIFESTLSHRAFGVSLHTDILKSLSKAIVGVLSVYFALKMVSLGLRGNFGLILEGSAESYLYILEIVMGIILPIVLFSTPRVKGSQQGLFYTSLLVVLGVVLNRMNVGITGMERYSGNAYFPSFLEVMTTVFIIAVGFVAFALIARYFPIFPIAHEHEEAEEEQEEVEYAPLEQVEPQRGHSRVATPLGAGILAGLALLFVGLGYWAYHRTRPAEPLLSEGTPVMLSSMRELDMGAADELSMPPDYVFPMGSVSPGTVVFSHKTHVKDLAQACTNCHSAPYKMAAIDRPGDESKYGRMVGCGHCHDGKKAFDVDRSCHRCHGDSSTESAAAVVERLPKTLDDFEMPAMEDTMGRVVFSHRAHVIENDVVCGKCHPATYRMKRTQLPADGKYSKDEHFAWGHKCGNCHDGQEAFRVSGNCAKCHGEKDTPQFDLSKR